MAKESRGDRDDGGSGEGIPIYPRCEDCNCIITNEEVDGMSFVIEGKRHFITYRCERCTMLEYTRIVQESLGLPPVHLSRS